MDSIREIGIYVLTGLIGLVAFFLREVKSETDKKISSLFSFHNEHSKEICALRERIARLEK